MGSHPYYLPVDNWISNGKTDINKPVHIHFYSKRPYSITK